MCHVVGTSMKMALAAEREVALKAIFCPAITVIGACTDPCRLIDMGVRPEKPRCRPRSLQFLASAARESERTRFKTVSGRRYGDGE